MFREPIGEYAVFCIGHPYGASKLKYADGTEFEDPMPFEEIRFKLDTVEPLWYEDIKNLLTR